MTQNRLVEFVKLGLLILDLILGGGGGGGGGEGGMLTTMLRKHTQQYHHKSRFTSVFPVLSSCRTFLHNLKPYFWSMRIINFAASNCSQKTRHWFGESFFSGMFLAGFLR